MSHLPIAHSRPAPTSYAQLDEENGVAASNAIPLDSIHQQAEGGYVAKSAGDSARRLKYIIGLSFLALLLAGAIVLVVWKVRGGSNSSDRWNDEDDIDFNDGRRIQGGGQKGGLTNAYQVATQPKNVQMLDITPRLQWNQNYGYCGSTSMINAGMYYGEYISQYDNRFIASNGTNQKKQSSQLLLGVNDYWASHQHKMKNELYPVGNVNIEHFFTWVKSHILSGHPVIIGVYENESVFGNDPPDDDYDHIVPVIGWGSNHDLSDPAYYADDVIYFSDNGLYTPDGKTPVYKISAEIGTFAQSRKNANGKSAAVYSINGKPTKDTPNYGIAITGLVDIHNDCLPTRLTSNKNYESPEIVDGSNTRPKAMAMTLTVTVSGLTVGESYNIYRYSAIANVPSSEFNANSDNAAQTYNFKATSETYSMTVDIQSSDLAIFRTVLASAP